VTLQELFDAAAEFGASIVLIEDRAPTAERELRAWAADRNLELEDDTHVVPDDHPMVDWRGMWVSTIAVHHPGPRWGTVTVHRSDKAA
jgi:hypothetical protein